ARAAWTHARGVGASGTGHVRDRPPPGARPGSPSTPGSPPGPSPPGRRPLLPGAPARWSVPIPPCSHRSRSCVSSSILRGVRRATRWGRGTASGRRAPAGVCRVARVPGVDSVVGPRPLPIVPQSVTCDTGERVGAGNGREAGRPGLRAGRAPRAPTAGEAGWAAGCGAVRRGAVGDAGGPDLLEEDKDGVVDAVLLWGREGDGGLVDRLMDVVTPLADEGHVWVLTPKTGTDGHVEPAVIAESAQTAGMLQTRTAAIGDWVGSRLSLRKGK